MIESFCLALGIFANDRKGGHVDIINLPPYFETVKVEHKKG